MDQQPQINITLYESWVPEDLLNKLPDLYKSYCSIFEALSPPENSSSMYTVRINSAEDKLAHLLLFSIKGHAVTLLNQVAYISPDYLEIFSKYIFKKFPKVNRIFYNAILTEISQVPAPFRLLGTKDTFVISLPDNFETYTSQLSKATFKNTKRKLNNLKKAYSDFSFNVIQNKDITQPLVHHIIEMNRTRMRSMNKASGITRENEESIFRLAQKYGVITTIQADNKIIGGQICYKIGNSYHSDVNSHDINYNDFSPGFLTDFLTVEHCIKNKGASYSLGWGDYPYKRELLAEKQILNHFAIYRSKIHKITCYRSLILMSSHHKEKVVMLFKTSLKKHKKITTICKRISSLAKGLRIT